MPCRYGTVLSGVGDIFHYTANKLKHRNGEMGAAVISKKINRNFWFFFLTFIPDRFANLNNAPTFKKVEIWSGTLPYRR